MGEFSLGMFDWIEKLKVEIRICSFLKTSADCGETEDVIQAYHRLIDLKTKYVDKEVEFCYFKYCCFFLKKN